MENLKDLATEQLLQYYANASRTCSCGGHHKAEMNELYREDYAKELGARGVFVPKDLNEKFSPNFKANVYIPKGIFNGKGSY